MKAMAGLIVEQRVSKPFTPRLSTGVLARYSVQLFSIFICIAMLAACGHGQALLSTSVPFPEAPLPTFSKDVQEVNLVLTVTNKHGRFVRDLNPKDLSILDNDLPPERITSFQSQTDLPLRVALVIDTSDSITHRFRFEQDAAAAFLKKILRPTSDVGLVIGFNQRVHVAGDATNDPKKLKDDLHRLSLGGETAVYDAVKVAAQQLSKIHDNQPVRRAIILITDGEDNRSHIGLEDAISAALHGDAVVYVLTTNPELSISLAQQGDHDMQLLAGNTGGRLLRAGEDDDVKSAFNKLAQELRSQYAISYKPAINRPDGLFHHLIVSGPKRLRIYHRLGYFAR